MAYSDGPGRSRRLGFSTYADDTPRFGSFDEADRAEFRFDDEDAPSDWDDEPPEAADPSPSIPRLPVFLAMAVGAATLAFVGTALVRSIHHQAELPRPAPIPAAAAQSRVGSPLMSPAASAPVLPSASRPPGADTIADLGVASSQPTQPTATPTPKAAAKPDLTRRKSMSRRLLAPLDCARPISSAGRMVCGSPELLAQNRRMTRAYAGALAAGASPRMLRREQIRWVEAREAAAHRSRQAVASLYRSRIQALQSHSYRACAGVGRSRAAADSKGFAGVAHWLLSAPKKIFSPRSRPGVCE